MSIPFMAPEPTVPVMPLPIVAVRIFCQIRSMFIGSSPIRIGAMSCTAVSITLGHPLPSPIPNIPSSV